MELVFEEKWDKALPEQDRKKIEETFHQIDHTNKANVVTFTSLWQAKNYRHDLLVTVLINNYGKEEITFKDTNLAYAENDQLAATQHFQLDRVVVPAQTSMPWTFIFPKSSLIYPTIQMNGYIMYI